MFSANKLGLNLDEKVKTILHGFVEKVNRSKLKPNKLWVDKGRL